MIPDPILPIAEELAYKEAKRVYKNSKEHIPPMIDVKNAFLAGIAAVYADERLRAPIEADAVASQCGEIKAQQGWREEWRINRSYNRTRLMCLRAKRVGHLSGLISGLII